ncbi:MAG TPA: hypothetical protein PKI19_02785 [Elusimicrobiales bacterium]|nr:hypothetical protein [Elusimicrobiales bacterium]
MEIKPCGKYDSRVDGSKLLTFAGGLSAFKIYYVSIPGRPQPEKYEWPLSALTPAAFEAALLRLAPEGIGFVTAFPHITKIFRFAPSAETILHVRAYKTADLSPLGLERPDAYLEFACYAEAMLAADEYRSWAAAASVKEYLAYFSAFAGGPVKENAKLAAYASSPTTAK